MPAAIIARTDAAFTIRVEIPYGSSMLDCEEVIQQRLNEAGTLATAEALGRFDTDGSPIQVGDTKLTSMGKVLKEYQTPVRVRRSTPGKQSEETRRYSSLRPIPDPEPHQAAT